MEEFETRVPERVEPLQKTWRDPRGSSDGIYMVTLPVNELSPEFVSVQAAAKFEETHR